jgi:glycosyltransferase involved in cell wall biosynthesis
LKIALDATYSVGRHLSGVGVYSREMLQGLAAAHPEAEYAHCYRAHRLLRGLGWSGRRTRILGVGRPWCGFDVFHGLNQRLPEVRLKRAVCTFHDLFVLTAEYSTAEFRARFAAQARAAAERSDLIIAVSEFTARQVEGLLEVERGRLRVVPHGVRFDGGEEAEAARERVVLHVGAIQERKNLVRLIGAFEKAAAPGWRLVLAGSDGYGAEAVHARIAASPRRGQIEVTGWIPDEELDGWYRRAAVLAFVSLDEGFGIPALEAMGRGLAVMASRGTALEEVCGEAALLADPRDEEEIAEALGRLTADGALRAEYAVRGRARARLYPWARAVEQTWRVYEELMGGAGV